MSIRFGCHGSTWELDYDKETDYLDHIISVVKNSGFKGIDVQVSLLGKFKSAPEQLKEKLDEHGLELAALTLPFSWLGSEESEQERELADYYLSYLLHFPNALLNVAPRVGPNRVNLLTRQREIIQCANSLANRAYDQGIVCSFHPSSPPTSYFRVEEDYTLLFEELDTRYIGYTPDAGHIAFGGMDPVEIVKRYLPIIKHVHFKDASFKPEWKTMGQGEIDFPAIVASLTDYGYNGWIMVEEETKESSANPDNAIMNIGDYVRKELEPIAKGVRL
ncbi:sugar phosphate isomerase/epimerase [Neobacillus niacini]|uniref:sugar phosphate isomerase/epimerase family protein n=1 Tax=Neobacillus niacini TaxID=86668 RepID=UPI0021CB0B78|nr:sugar phosphate isomerase/epimerase [Neobacillus niacini]MCM3763864.1 sugar phosphate isomerase/epimerase [Neobacillus niacini]